MKEPGAEKRGELRVEELTLEKETIQDLTSPEAEDVAGGGLGLTQMCTDPRDRLKLPPQPTAATAATCR